MQIVKKDVMQIVKCKYGVHIYNKWVDYRIQRAHFPGRIYSEQYYVNLERRCCRECGIIEERNATGQKNPNTEAEEIR